MSFENDKNSKGLIWLNEIKLFEHFNMYFVTVEQYIGPSNEFNKSHDRRCNKS